MPFQSEKEFMRTMGMMRPSREFEALPDHFRETHVGMCWRVVVDIVDVASGKE